MNNNLIGTDGQPLKSPKKENCLSMQFPPEATQRIDAMAEHYGVTAGDIIGRSIALMEFAYVNELEGNSVGIVNQEGVVIEKLTLN